MNTRRNLFNALARAEANYNRAARDFASLSDDARSNSAFVAVLDDLRGIAAAARAALIDAGYLNRFGCLPCDY